MGYEIFGSTVECGERMSNKLEKERTFHSKNDQKLFGINILREKLVKRFCFKSEYLYYAAFTLYSIAYLLAYTTFKFPLFKIQEAAWAVLLVKVCMQKYRRSEIVFAIVLLSLGFYTVFVTNDYNFFSAILFIIAGQEIDIKKLSKLASVCLSVVITIVVVSYFLRIIPEESLYSESGLLRHSWGFSHPNRFGSTVFALVCSVAVYYFPKCSFPQICFFAPAAFAIDSVARSGTSAYCVLIVAALCLANSYFASKKQSAVLKMFLFGFVFLSSVSLYFMIFYDVNSQWMFNLNDLFSRRLELMNMSYKEIGFGIFGLDSNTLSKPAQMGMLGPETENGNLIDNMYVKTLIMYGLVPFIVMYSLYYIFFRKALIENNFCAAVFGLFLFSIFGFTEWSGTHFALNYCMVGFTSIIYNSNKTLHVTCENNSNVEKYKNDTE